MAETYSVKINRRDGGLEVSGDKEWVNAKLKELESVLKTPLSPVVTGATPSQLSAPEGHRRPSRATRSPRRAGKERKNADLEKLLTPEVKKKLEKYVSDRQGAFKKSLAVQAAILAGFLNKELDWPGVDRHDMYTVYSIMGFRQPGNISAQLINAYQRNQFFSGIQAGKFILSNKGENFAAFDARGEKSA